MEKKLIENKIENKFEKVIKKPIRGLDIQGLNLPFLKYEEGPQDQSCQGVSLPNENNLHALVFTSTLLDIEATLKNKPRIIICLSNLYQSNQNLFKKFEEAPCVFSTESITLAMSHILELFSDEELILESKIHPTAVIHPSAQIGQHVHIGPYVVIEEMSTVGNDVMINSHTIISKYSKIGSHSRIGSYCFVGPSTSIGEFCSFQSHVSIGEAGFGFIKDPFNQGRYRHIPQVGTVVIGNRVHISSFSKIDRSTLSQTVIGDDTKIDGHAHIAHNCSIGANSVMAAGFMIAGSSHVGHNFVCGGSTVISDHVKICDHVTLAGRSAVTNDIHTPGGYGGYPVQSLKDSLRTIASLPHLVEMRKQLSKITKLLNLKEP